MTGPLPPVLQTGLTLGDPLELVAALLGLGAATATVAGLVAAGYRWYVRERVPGGLGMLFGLTVVAVYLGTTGSLGAVISGQDEVLATSRVLPNLAAFAVGAAGAAVGTRVGDRVGTDVFAATGGRNVDADVSEVAQTVGRVTSVRLPNQIDDVVGYDPVPDATKEKLAGRRFLFPRRLTRSELRERLVSRLRTDYGVGHVDLELTEDGTVTYFAVGSRASGIGPTLPPATNAVPIRADPAHAAGSGDLVQVWSTDPVERVLTGELRGIAGEVVTVAIDAADTPKLDPTERYKLVTLPVQDRPDREFAALLRAADETMRTVTVEAGSDLVGRRVVDLGVTVAAITHGDDGPETIPPRDRVLAAGETIYAIATPDAIRRVEEAAAGPASHATDGEGRVTDEDDPVADDGGTVDDSGADRTSGETTPAGAPGPSDPEGEPPAGEGSDADWTALTGESAAGDATDAGGSENGDAPGSDAGAPAGEERDGGTPADDRSADEADAAGEDVTDDLRQPETGDGDDVEVWDPEERVGGSDTGSEGDTGGASDEAAGSVTDGERDDRSDDGESADAGTEDGDGSAAGPDRE